MKNLIILCVFAFTSINIYSQVEPLDTDNNGFRNISTLDELRWVSEHSEAWDQYYELDNDINAGDTRNWNDGLGFEPIGSTEYGIPRFTGRFDGKGHIIDSVYINPDKRSAIGFFGAVYDADGIVNLGITNAEISNSGYGRDMGGFIGRVDNVKIQNCFFTGKLSNEIDKQSIRGFIGRDLYDVIVENCYCDVEIVNKCNNGLSSEAGFVSSVSGCTYSNCWVRARYNYTGEYAKFVSYGGFTPMISSYGHIKNCYAMGSYTREHALDSLRVGGFLAITPVLAEYNEDSSIESCYSTVDINANTINQGGFISRNWFDFDLSTCFWDMEACGIDSSKGGNGRTTLQMKDIQTFLAAGWDFENIWDIDPKLNLGYPFLRGMPTLDVEEIEYPTTGNIVKLYPNPTSNFLYVNYDGILTNIKVFDITGRLMLTSDYKLIDVSNFSTGCYFLIIETENSTITENFIKE